MHIPILLSILSTFKPQNWIISIFTHLELSLATATHNFKSVEIYHLFVFKNDHIIVTLCVWMVN